MFAAQAPVLVLLLARLDILANRLGKQVQGVPFFLLDLGIAGEHFVLQAEELGLGTCWIGWFNIRRARKVLKIPRRFKIVSLLAVGYPASRPPRDRVRKPLEEVAWFNRVGG
jgi:nitroreductase